MRVGSLVYATEQGLGILAKSFYDHGIITDVMIIRHGKHETHENWYPALSTGTISNLRDNSQISWIREWCRQVDAMLFFETPFDWTLPAYCRSVGVKTVMMPMYECYPERYLKEPWDLVLCPSLLDYRYFNPTDSKVGAGKVDLVHIPVEVPWRQRTKAEVFVHNAGHLGLRGRNGTRELYSALQYVKSPVKLILRTQDRWPGSPDFSQQFKLGNVTVDYRYGTYPHETLWDEGDVFIFPEKFQGDSMPLAEARAAGMLVMGTDRFPMNEWLPRVWPTEIGRRQVLIETAGDTYPVRIGPAYLPFHEAILNPKTIAEYIDGWYGQDISSYSSSAQEWAAAMSWDALKPRYIELLEALL